jgi:cytoskeleton protein RodZ
MRTMQASEQGDSARMFEIGSSLREARTRRGLELDDAVRATLIRSRYLEALEDERFDLLPEGFYRRSFLRRYAEFLGLDGQTLLAEYDLRLAANPPEPESRPRRRRARGAPLASVAGLGGILALLAVVGIAVWSLAGSNSQHTRTGGRSPLRHATSPLPPARRKKAPAAPVARAAVVLVLRATHGACWLSVRIGSSGGHAIFTGTLQPGRAVRFGLRKPLWIRFGAPQNLEATLDGRAVSKTIPPGPGDVRASATGLRPVP